MTPNLEDISNFDCSNSTGLQCHNKKYLKHIMIYIRCLHHCSRMSPIRIVGLPNFEIVRAGVLRYHLERYKFIIIVKYSEWAMTIYEYH
jgi:hypothetical protein